MGPGGCQKNGEGLGERWVGKDAAAEGGRGKVAHHCRDVEVTTMQLIVYFDYTCPYSYAAAVWLQQVATVQHGLEIEWRPFVLNEVNRASEEHTPF